MPNFNDVFDTLQIDPNALFFTEDDLNVSSDPLVKLIRNFFYQEKITNKEYLDRYLRSYKSRFPDGNRSEFISKATADRKFLRNPEKITFNMTKLVLEAMGFTIQDVQIVVLESPESETKILSSSL